jgi:acetyltransferase-like isoleucine patch superfamily enzyme
MAGACINPRCSIGRHCIVNTLAGLDHDSRMDDFSSLAPGTAVGGNCHIGTCSAIGIGAAVSHDLKIGDHSLVGAGSTVLKDVAELTVAFGSPARTVRSRRAGEPYL